VLTETDRKLTREDILNRLQSSKIKSILPPNPSIEVLRTIYKLSTLQNPLICDILRTWFIDNNYAVYE